MKKTFWNKRIPSFLGLLFLAISVGMVTWFGRNYTQLRGKASVGDTPKQVQISNITDTSFVVSYTTDDQITGSISYGRDSKFGQVGLDDGDKEAINPPSGRRLHYITILGLDPGAKYFFSIQSGAKEFLNNNQPYEVTTATTLPESPPNAKSIRGSVNLPDGTIPTDVIVYLSTTTSQLLSSPLKSDGTYLLPGSLLSSDLTSYITLDKDTILQITFHNPSSESHVLVKAANSDPVPLITLSKDYNFTIDTPTNLTASQSGALSPASSSGFPVFSSVVANEPAILTPKENEKFVDQQPLFRGTAARPNAIVVINIDSTQGLQNNVKADNFNNWQFRPSSPLIPGQHFINIQTLDASGIKQTITRSFTILAQGSQFTEPSVSPTSKPTPSPTQPEPTISASPTPSPTQPVPTVSPTSTPLPTVTVTLTPTPTLTPTLVPSPTVVQPTTAPTMTTIPTSPPTSVPIAPPGSSSLFLSGALAILSLTAGFMIFFLL